MKHVINTKYRSCPKCTYPLRNWLDLDGLHVITSCTNKACNYSRTRKVNKCQK